MRWFVKTASAAALSLCLLAPAHAAPNGDHDPGIVPTSAGGSAVPESAIAKGQFDDLHLTISNGGMDGGSTVMDIGKDGSYTVFENGGMAHFVILKAQGKLSDADLKALEGQVNKAIAAKPPANMPGLVPGSPEFTISWKQGSSSGTVSGATNTKAAIADAKSRGLDVSDWKVVASLLKKFQGVEDKAITDYKPTLPTPDKKAAFDEISIEEHNSWTGGVDKLTVKADGSYTLERSLGQSTLTGVLSKTQLDAIVKAYDSGVMKTEDGKMVGGMIPDDTSFTITSSEGGKTYKVNGFVDSQNLGDLAKLERALVGDVNSLQPPVAKPIDKTAEKDKTAAADGVTDAIKNRGAGETGPRTGMGTILEDRTREGEGKDKAGDK